MEEVSKIAGDFCAAVPASAVEAVERTLSDLRGLKVHLLRCLPMADPDALAELPPLDRARIYLTFAKTATTLYSLILRCSGINPGEHQVKSEIERLQIYEKKLEKCCEQDKAPLRPSTTINYQAATRVIHHALPDLTTEQKNKMREISRREGSRNRSSHKKRKYQHSSEKPSARVAAKEFLEKAMRELLGSNKDGLKGPLRINMSDEENGETN